jgi:hypothetical protein
VRKRSRKKAGGSSGGEYEMTKLTLAERVNNAFNDINEREFVDKIYLNQLYSNSRITAGELRNSIVRIIFLYFVFYLLFTSSIKEVNFGPVKISDLNLLIKIMPLLIAISYYDLSSLMASLTAQERLIFQIFKFMHKPIRDMGLDSFLFPSTSPLYTFHLNQNIYEKSILVQVYSKLYILLEVFLLLSGILVEYEIIKFCFQRYGFDDSLLWIVSISSIVFVVLALLELLINKDKENSLKNLK